MKTGSRLFGYVGGISLLVACSSGGTDGKAPTSSEGLGDGEIPGDRGSYGRGSGSASEDGAAMAAPDDGGGEPMAPAEPGSLPSTSGGSGLAQPGTLTAGVWDDNRNFERFSDYRKANGQLSGALPFAEAEFDAALAASKAPKSGKLNLDVSFVIDTTGSMGDEMNYLKTEFLALSDTIHKLYPNAEQRWSLVVYKDKQDEYLVRWFGFRDDPNDFLSNLAAQDAGGGGDFPEAPDAALEIMNKLAWRSGPETARLAFLVADAPHHDQNAAAMAAAIRGAQKRDVHLYPVASSGVDELTELSLRSAAQLTLGRYLFLTDDSGVGGAHKEPSIPCYFVTKLDAAILRVVDIELSGKYHEPGAKEILRTGGNPTDGACKLSSGATVLAF